MGISDMVLQVFLLYYGSPSFHRNALRDVSNGDTIAPLATDQFQPLRNTIRFLANFNACPLFHTSNDPKGLPYLTPSR